MTRVSTWAGPVRPRDRRTGEQITLFSLPRRLELGEPVRCGRCGRCDHHGGFGPPIIMEIHLSDGAAWTVNGAEIWLCADHQAREWRGHMERKRQRKARRQRLDVFRACQLEGLQGIELFAEAERRLGVRGER